MINFINIKIKKLLNMESDQVEEKVDPYLDKIIQKLISVKK